MLFQDPETYRRYEVEIQLGKTDESHLIRTIEYWDIERKRYPQYDHCAVIVAEDITGRFLNVINLFNGFIPLVAIQMKAFKFGDDTKSNVRISKNGQLITFAVLRIRKRNHIMLVLLVTKSEEIDLLIENNDFDDMGIMSDFPGIVYGSLTRIW